MKSLCQNASCARGQSLACMQYRPAARRPCRQHEPVRARPSSKHSQFICRVADSDQATAPAAEASPAKALETSIADFARAALQSDPEAAAQLKRYEEAVVRLEKAKAADKELEKAMREARKQAAEEDAAAAAAQQQAASQLLADAEVAAAQKLLQAAELKFQVAKQQEVQLASSMGQDAERIESGKAAAVAALGGSLGALPLLLAGGGGTDVVLSLATAIGGCALFGVTYRYAVRPADATNPHLKGGVVAAFGLMRAAGALDVLATTSDAGVLTPEVVGPAALYALQSVLTVAFAATALEAAFNAGGLRRFGAALPRM